MMKKWEKSVDQLNSMDHNKDSKDSKDSKKIIGYVGLIILYAVLPYDKLDDVGKYFTNFEINNINICYFCISNCDNLPFEDLDDLINAGPIFPPAYQEWLEDQYNQASWCILYMVYEKNNHLSPIIDSDPAKIQK